MGMNQSPEPAVPRFDRDFWDSATTVTRIGDGALGGKAASLWLAASRILECLDDPAVPEFEVVVPRMTVITTEVFDAFMRHNDLLDDVLSEDRDDRVAHAFQRAEFPPFIVGDLRSIAAGAHMPLAIRSSSLLEDQLCHPFAGVYGTKMIPNHQASADARFRKLVEAIKFVYASTYFRAAKDYAAFVGKSIENEKMAVIVQEIVGLRCGDRFYPTISGVARSFNYYPFGNSRPEQGVINLALGLGKTIVDGGISWTYSPAHPRRPAPFGDVRDLMRNTQTKFWAVNMGPAPAPDPIREAEYLVHRPLRDAEYDDMLRFVASTYDGSADRLVPGVGIAGPRVLDFAPTLVINSIPLNSALRRLLSRSEEVMAGPVELEFAVVLDVKGRLPARFGFLQVRPMAVADEQVEVLDDDLDAPDLLLSAENVMGTGARVDVADIVYVKREDFDGTASRDVAREIEAANRRLVEEQRPYVLIGFGRWGSSDPWLGVPVTWSQIAGAAVIVETTLPRMSPDPSQGSHFFQNLIAFKVLYYCLRHDGAHKIDWEWLERQPIIQEGPHVRHVRLDHSLDVRADGRAGQGVIRYDS